MELWKYLGAAILGGVVAGALVLGMGLLYLADLEANLQMPQEETVARVYDGARGSVAKITALEYDPAYPNRPRPVEAVGTGIVIREDGYLLTNYHVIKDAMGVRVTLPSGEAEGEVVGYDIGTDLAVVKVAASGLTPLHWGASASLRPGQLAIALGNPFGLEGTMTVGYVSAVNRSLLSDDGYAIEGVVQTDAPLNPGNSGGPLLNSRGEVVGINTRVFSKRQGEGLGFAIPSDTARKVAEELMEKGRVVHPWLGISGRTLTDEMREALNLSVEGVLVTSVVEGGPAYGAGLRPSGDLPGDIILGLGGERVESMDELVRIVQGHRVGEELEIQFLRNGTEMKVTVTLGERPRR